MKSRSPESFAGCCFRRKEIMKKVLSVGQCMPDNSSLSHFLKSSFDVEIHQAKLPADTLAALRRDSFDLVLINRKLDEDYSDGLEILQMIKQDRELKNLPVMIITNYPEHQAAAVAAGAVHGFGKNDLHSPKTADLLRPYLS